MGLIAWEVMGLYTGGSKTGTVSYVKCFGFASL